MLSLSEVEFNKVFPDSLLAFLVSYSDHSECDDIWQHPRFADFRPEIKEFTLRMRTCSLMSCMDLLYFYNLQLAERRSSDDLKFYFEEYWEQWLGSLEFAKIREWDLNRMWDLISDQGHTISWATRRFVSKWVELVNADPQSLRFNQVALDLVKNRERETQGTTFTI